MMSRMQPGMKTIWAGVILCAAVLHGQTARPDPLEGVWQGYDGEWLHVSRQLTELAEAFPAEKFAWRPAPGVRSTSEVFMHIAAANFYLLSVTGPQAPAEINRPDFEKTVTAKPDVIDWLKRSLDAVKTAHASVTPADLQRRIKVFNRDATVDGMYLRILVHANEHMGQLVAYARMNGVTPPWSETVAARPARPAPPTRDPKTPGYVAAKELPDGANAPADADGNFILGPTHNPAPEMTVQEGVPQGSVYTFRMESTESRIYPGIARDANTFGAPDPADPAKLVVTTSHPAPYTRSVAVYVPKQYVPGTAAPFIVGADGPDRALFTALDNLIAQHRVPVMIAISISNGSGDAQGSERGLEYDTMSGRYAEFVENEVLPRVEKQYNVKLTKDPEGRATMGGSSGGSCALIMAWYHPELYHRVLTYSGTYVNQQWQPNAETPHGAWEFHEHLIPESPRKPIRIWMEVGDRDLYNPNVMRDNMHDWVLANENMARVLAAKGYHYQFVFARNAGHTDRAVKQQTLPEALEYLWQGYRSDASGK